MDEKEFKKRAESKRLGKLEITKDTDKKPFVFVSYKSDDWQEVLEDAVYTLQKKYGLRVYYDRDFEENNDYWIKSMKENMESSYCVAVLAFFSKNYLSSYATFLELLTSQTNECAKYSLNSRTKAIIPILDKSDQSLDKLVSEIKKNSKKNLGIKKVEWDYFLECCEDSKLSKEFMPKEIKNICEDISKKKSGDDLKTSDLAIWFKEGEYIFAKNMNFKTLGEKFYSNIISTIKKIENDISDLGDSSIDEKLINNKDLDIPMTIQSEHDQGKMQEELTNEDNLTDTVTLFASHSNIDGYDLNIPQYTNAETEPVVEKTESDKIVCYSEINENPAMINNKSELLIEQNIDSETESIVAPNGLLTYVLYDELNTGNQSEIMIRTIGKVLKKHPQFIDKSYNIFTCLSNIDYMDPVNRNETMPSYFRTCQTFKIDEKNVCIGTSYSFNEKLKLIAKLLAYVGEDSNVLQIKGKEIPKVNKVPASNDKMISGNAESINYTIFNKKKTGNQSEMMWGVFEELVNTCPQSIENLTILSSVKKASDVVKAGTKEAMPSYFRGYQEFEVLGVKYYVGSSFSKEAKLVQIRKMLEICNIALSEYVIDGEDIKQETTNSRVRKIYEI